MTLASEVNPIAKKTCFPGLYPVTTMFKKKSSDDLVRTKGKGVSCAITPSEIHGVSVDADSPGIVHVQPTVVQEVPTDVIWFSGIKRQAEVNSVISSGVRRFGSCSQDVTNITSDICLSIRCLAWLRSTRIRTLRILRSASVKFHRPGRAGSCSRAGLGVPYI